MAVELIPAQPQALWGKPAVANFVLGGLGAGLYVAAALEAGFAPSPAVSTASWLGPLLVLTGFAAVGAEAGRPVRGARVLARVRTSWMSRELWAGGAFMALAALGLAYGSPWQRGLAATAALAVAAAQGFILRRARGVAAWNVPMMPLLFVLSALVSGAGLLMLIEVAGGRPSDPVHRSAMLVLLAVDGLAWLAYVSGRRDEAFVRSTRGLREGGAVAAVAGGGHLVPFLVIGLSLAAPGVAGPASALAAVLMIGGQVCAKVAVVLRAGELRAITIPGLRLQRRPSS